MSLRGRERDAGLCGLLTGQNCSRLVCRSGADRRRNLRKFYGGVVEIWRVAARGGAGQTAGRSRPAVQISSPVVDGFVARPHNIVPAHAATVK